MSWAAFSFEFYILLFCFHVLRQHRNDIPNAGAPRTTVLPSALAPRRDASNRPKHWNEIGDSCNWKVLIASILQGRRSPGHCAKVVQVISICDYVSFFSLREWKWNHWSLETPLAPGLLLVLISAAKENMDRNWYGLLRIRADASLCLATFSLSPVSDSVSAAEVMCEWTLDLAWPLFCSASFHFSITLRTCFGEIFLVSPR